MSANLALADGCFDPFHPGHLLYLAVAKTRARELKNADLVVRLAGDDEVRLKHEPLLTQAERAALVAPFADDVVETAESAPAVIRRLRPVLYLKGDDWRHTLPASHRTACREVGCDVDFTNTVVHSSTRILATWRQATDATALRRLEAVATAPGAPTTWAPVTDSRVEARRAREGHHPDLIVQHLVTPGINTVLDYGCGPGHLVRLLRERLVGTAVAVMGYDPQIWPDEPLGIVHDPSPPAADLVICREVLEHVPLRQFRHTVTALCACASRMVYVTTRLCAAPLSAFDLDTQDHLDPDHKTMLTKELLRALFVLEGFRRRPELEAAVDWTRQGRCFIYERAT